MTWKRRLLPHKRAAENPWDILSKPSKESDIAITIFDIGDGRGETSLEVRGTFPHLPKSSLSLQDYHPSEINADKLTVTHWDFRDLKSP